MRRADITVARLRELLAYDPITGTLTWRVRASRRAKPGDVAGSALKDGRLCVGIDNVRGVYAHRIAWAIYHGEWPRMMLDHRDGNPSNNAIANLREATRSMNNQNVHRVRSDSQSGVLGAMKHHNRYRAKIQIDGKQRVIGSFDTAEEAHAAYVAAKRLHHPASTL